MVRIIENYALHEIIGEGAYGKVFRAINRNDEREYAVKVIEVRRFKENKKLEECTVNQINILTNIGQHDHIIKYIDMLKTPNNFYFVYEFCNGGTLERMLQNGPLSEKNTLLIFKQLIDAFQVLNKYNIMHRDLKPDNIFFKNGVVKLGDFGFCKSLQKATMTNTMLGSPIYMAPQILKGEIYSTKADIWSLGVVLYEMLYGICPFESSTIGKLIEMLKETELIFPKNDSVSEETRKLIKRLLTKDSTKRIEWMELLRINITPQGRLQPSGRPERLSLVEEDNFSQSSSPNLETKEILSSQTTANSYQNGYSALSQSIPSPLPPQQPSSSITQSQKYSPTAFMQETKVEDPPKAHDIIYHPIQTDVNPVASQAANQLFLKKKYPAGEVISNPNTSNEGRQKSGHGNVHSPPHAAYEPKPNGGANFKRAVDREHSETIKGTFFAAELIKSNNPNGMLFAYLILKKAEERLNLLKKEVSNSLEQKEIVKILDEELKEIRQGLAKFSMSEDVGNWKRIVKSTGDFHRNYRSFYMMVIYMSGEAPGQDLTHSEMQIAVRNRIE